MGVFNVLANIASVATIASVAIDAGQRGFKNGSKSAQNAVAIKDIKDYTGDSVLNKPSEKHNSMKAMVRESDFFTGFYKAGGAVSGFIKGAGESLKGTLPMLGFSALTLASKNKTAKTVGLVGMGVSHVWDFLKNGTNLFTKKDIIEK